MNGAPPGLLVDPQWLVARLGQPSVRVLECTTHLHPQPVGPSRIVSGLPEFEQGHIPGARYVHLATDVSDPEGRYPYTLPPAAVLEARLHALGVGAEDQVVLYARGGVMSAARVWFVLHALGHRAVSILDGGFERWCAEGGPVVSSAMEQAAQRVPPARPWQARLQPQYVADLNAVRAALGDPDTVLVNALSRPQFLGTGGAHYGRPGCIPGSVSVPARDLVDERSGRFLEREALAERFSREGVLQASRAIIYCGGGVAASVNAFVLELLGHPGWSLYDNSLLEWSTLPDTPMVCAGGV